MQEMKAKEVQVAADAERLEAERLAALRSAVEAASIDWEAELLFAVEKLPGLLDAVRHMVLAGIQPPQKMVGLQGLIWVNSLARSHHAFDSFNPKCLYDDSCAILAMLKGIQYGFTEADVPRERTLLNERARFRVHMLTKIFHSLQGQAKTEARAAAATKAAEEARMAAEKAAAQAAAAYAAVEEQRIKMNAIATSLLADTLHFRTIQHNYTNYEAPETLFAAYKEYTPTGKRWLHVRRLTMGQVQEAHVRPHMCDFSSSHGSAPALVVPESWADHYETGKTPFLTVCPVCKKAPKMHPTESNYMQYSGGQVECTEHYKWEPSTNTHYKWALMPPPPPPSASAHPVYGRLPPGMPLVATIPRPSGHWVLWDPKDSDGAKAAQAAKEKKIAETQAEIKRLMATLE